MFVKHVLMWPLLWYFRFWARLVLFRHKPIIIGIAGSVGKSSTRNAIAAILQDHFPTKVIAGNSETGIPLGLVGLTPTSFSALGWLSLALRMPFGLDYLRGTKYAIIEMGIDDPYPPKNMEYLLTFLHPHIAVSLNIAGPHLGQFEKTVRGKIINDQYGYILDRMADEDTKIISQSQCKIGIYNANDTRIKELMQQFKERKNKTTLLSFGKEADNTTSYGKYELTTDQTSFEFAINTNEKEETSMLVFEKLLLPLEYREVFAAALLVGLQTGVSLSDVSTSLQKNFNPPKSRASIFEGIHETTIIDSSYNAPPKAVSTFLQMVKELKKQTKKHIVFVMGDMRELGEEAQLEHEKIAQETVGIVDYLFCVGPLTQKYVLPIVDQSRESFKEVRWFLNYKYAGEYLAEFLPEKSIILVKGSQNTIFLEETIKYILKNKKDENELCRQEAVWSEQKQQAAH